MYDTYDRGRRGRKSFRSNETDGADDDQEDAADEDQQARGPPVRCGPIPVPHRRAPSSGPIISLSEVRVLRGSAERGAFFMAPWCFFMAPNMLH